METFTERLNYAIARAGYSQAQLARLSDMSQAAINKLTSGKAKGSRKLVDIARVLGVRPEWLADGTGEMESEQHPVSQNTTSNRVGSRQAAQRHDEEVTVPLLEDIEYIGENGEILDEHHATSSLSFSKEILRQIGADVSGSGIVSFPIRGDSMEPALPDGSLVAINVNDKRIVDGKLYAINEGGWKRVKLMQRVSPDKVLIMSYKRNFYPDVVADLNDLEVIGRVFWYSVLL